MGNLSFVSSKKKLDFHEVTSQLEEINQRRFGGFFQIVPNEEFQEWTFSYEGAKDPLFRRNLTETRKKISGKLPRSPYAWAVWAMSIFEHELGYLWKGRISCEAFPETWEPELNKYLSFKDYLEELSGGYKNDHQRKVWEGIHIPMAPEKLRPFIEPENR